MNVWFSLRGYSWSVLYVLVSLSSSASQGLFEFPIFLFPCCLLCIHSVSMDGCIWLILNLCVHRSSSVANHCSCSLYVLYVLPLLMVCVLMLNLCLNGFCKFNCKSCVALVPNLVFHVPTLRIFWSHHHGRIGFGSNLCFRSLTFAGMALSSCPFTLLIVLASFEFIFVCLIHVINFSCNSSTASALCSLPISLYDTFLSLWFLLLAN